MGLFDKFYYGKAGKRDYSEMDMPKNRVSLFFMVFKDHFFDLIKVNLMQILFWVPFILWTYTNLAAVMTIDAGSVLAQEGGAMNLLGAVSSYMMMWLLGAIPCIAITGPSSAGAAYIMRNWARDQHTFLFSDYKDAFKSNWKQALAISAITSVVPLIVYTAAMYYGTLAKNNAFLFVPLIFVLSAAFVFLLMLPLFYPLMVGYELRFRHVVKNALLISLAGLPQMILARLITAVPLVLLVGGFLLGSGGMVLFASLYYLLFGFALSRLVYASFSNALFDKFLNPHIEGAVVGQGLRPHDIDEDFDLDDDDEEDEDDD